MALATDEPLHGKVRPFAPARGDEELQSVAAPKPLSDSLKSGLELPETGSRAANMALDAAARMQCRVAFEAVASASGNDDKKPASSRRPTAKRSAPAEEINPVASQRELGRRLRELRTGL